MFVINDKTTLSKRSPKLMEFGLDIKNSPEPLTLLINPTNFELKFVPKISEQRVRWSSQNIGYVFQSHHDELDVMTASGTSAMFVTKTEGITRVNRRLSYGYQNIEQLVAIYRNNGININSKPGKNINPCMIDSVGRVVIIYDNYIYRGHFLSLTISENDEKQFNINFSFEYKITQNINLGNVINSTI